MKSIRLILVLVISVILFSSNVKAQQKVGVIVMMEDSLITHLHIGWTIIENIKAEYPLPFDIEEYCYKSVESVFKNNNKMEFIHLDKKLYKDYLNVGKNLSRKEKKNYKKSWLEGIKSENNIDALLVIVNTDVKIIYGMNGNSINVGKICICTGISKVSSINLKMVAYAFIDGKPKKIKSENITLTSNEYPRNISKKKPYSPEQLLNLEEPLKKLIQLQITEFKAHPNYKNMLALLRHQAALEKYNKMNPK